MATVLSTLYPPLIDTFMPAFPKTKSAVINFSISPYNSRASIKKLHVSVVDQRTNLSVLKSSGSLGTDSCFVNGIWIINANNNDLNYLYVNSDNTCQLTIPKEALKDEEFVVSNYYKVQLRFSNEDMPLTGLTNTYLTEQRPYFSEWSSICLIKAIPEITLQIVGYDSNNDAQKLEAASLEAPKNFSAGIIPIAGNILFGYEAFSNKEDNTNLTETMEYYQISTKDRETLRSYEIKIQNENEEIIDESGIIYTYNNENPNDIYWLADLTNENAGNTYKITINCITKNQYEFSFSYYIKLANFIDDPFTVTWTFGNKIYDNESHEICLYPDLQEDGQLKINIQMATNKELGPGYLYIKRATSLDNFKHWEIIKCTKFSSDDFSVNDNNNSNKVNLLDTFIDTTIGSLVRYKYSCQYLQDASGQWTKTKISPEIIYPKFYDILLSRENKQLAIRYNGQISGITPIVNRIKIDTLGGKYPKFAENAKMNYKQFQISGMIVAESDYNRKFLNDLDYIDDMAIYNQEMDGQYLLRNDTLPDIWPNTQYGTYHNDIAIAKDPQSNPTKIQKHKRDTSEFKYIPPETQTISINESDPNNPKIEINQIYPENIIAHDIYPTNNWWWERTFREEAMKWLNDGEPKLFRSMTEGNMVVMLTDISLTPNTQTGRRIYNFSATAYEIADGYSLEVLSNLGIWKFQNDYENNPITEEDYFENYTVLAQSLSVTGTGQGLVSNIEDYYNFYYAGTNLRESFDSSQPPVSSYLLSQNSIVLNNVKIQFESKPHWYKIYQKNGISKVDIIKEETIEKLDIKNISTIDNYALGYYMQIRIQGIADPIGLFINEKGYYQIPSNINVLDIILQQGDIATIDYILNYKTEFNDSDIADSIEVKETIIGQLSGLWHPNTTLRSIIFNKYNYIEKDPTINTIIFTQVFEDWAGISFDIAPYTLISIQFKDTEEFVDYIIGRTGVYDLMKNDIAIQDVIIKGRRMFEVYNTGSIENTSQQYHLDEWEFIKENSGEGITNPQYNHVYSINGINKIYYIDDEWYDFEYDGTNHIGLAKVPVSGIINYKGNINKKTYS